MPISETPRSLFGRFAKAARGNWRSRARPAQIPPEDFSVYFELGGRGSGKNWSAANYVHEQAALGAARRIALVGATADAVRFTMVEGESGILAVARAGERPIYEPGKQQLTWPSGSIARLYSADTPETLRGPEHDLAWCDELAAWRRADETWSNLLLTMRIGKRPRIIVTSTPKPTRLVRDLVARNGTDGIVVARMTTYDNRANLSPSFFAQLVKKFEGTRLARQELLAEVLEDTPGALWNRDLLESTRVDAAPPLARIVIAVDPAGSSAEGADETGIVCAGLGQDGQGYVLSDVSGRYAPNEWARKALSLFHSLRADKIVVERNYGGEMAAATIASIDAGVPIKEVSSSRGKVLRAEPVSSLFEQKRAHLVGSLSELEDQMCSFTSDWNRGRDGSPDRVDAMVFALTELMLGQTVGTGFFSEESLLVNSAPVPPPRFVQVLAALGRSDAVAGAVGVCYCAVAKDGASIGWLARGERPPFVLLDYDVVTLEASNRPGWLPSVFARLAELQSVCDSRRVYPATVWAEQEMLGPMWAGECAAQMLPLHLLPEGALPDLDERAMLARDWITRDCVKLGPEAYARRVPLGAVTANHLIEQLLGYMPGTKGGAQELVAALSTAILITLPGAVSTDVAAPAPALSAEPVPTVASPPPIRTRMITAAEWRAQQAATVAQNAQAERARVAFASRAALARDARRRST